MEMQFTEHFQDVLQEYKKVFMEVTRIDESLIDDESLILGLLAHDMERMKKSRRFRALYARSRAGHSISHASFL